MFVMLIKTIFLINLLPIIFSFPFNKRQSNSDDMCGPIRSTLCVHEYLNHTAKAAKMIEHTAHQIERHILNEIKIIDTFNNHANYTSHSIQSPLPSSHYHDRFSGLSNINKTYLIHLFLEAHFAMGFYYNSIHDISNKHMMSSYTTNIWFQDIANTLKKEIICRYRSILDVYSAEWPSINQINRIQFGPKERRDTLDHEARSVVIAKLLSQWMHTIRFVISNLENKLL